MSTDRPGPTSQPSASQPASYGLTAASEPYGAPQGYDAAQPPTGTDANQPYGTAEAYQPYAPYGQQSYQDPVPQGGYQMTPYGQAAPSPYGYGAVEHPQSTLVLVLGLLSMVAVPILGPFALYSGNKARKEVKANPGRYTTGSLTAGWVMGIIGTIWLVLSVLLIIVYIFFFLALGNI